MRVVWTIHSLERLKQRRITRDEVLETIRDPDSTMRDRQGNTMYVKRFGNDAIVVVARSDNSKVLVITAYRTTKFSKYLG
ncbi:MAG: DUF4258 domain-containing protein [Candidatus Diapherotrites archaeon]|nr:DUF4258 domain-containing protein [Candidatus Diapherotrites archaeon]